MSKNLLWALAFLSQCSNALDQTSANIISSSIKPQPLAQRCPGRYTRRSDVACVNRYASVMPYPFSRTISTNGTYNPEDQFGKTNVTDPSFTLVRNATFVVFDTTRGLDILGSSPSHEVMFEVENVVHEAPVYVPPPMNAIIFSALSPTIVPQLIIDLNKKEPTIANYTPSPPVLGVNGGRFFQGKVYWSVDASDFLVNNKTVQQAPGIIELDPYTRKTRTVLNNYFGQKFNSPDDLAIDNNGDIYFTDPFYGYALGFTSKPVLQNAVYRFRPSTGAVSIVETDIGSPNGIAISPDGKTLYVTDTSVAVVKIRDDDQAPGFTVDTRLGKSVYAFDMVDSPAGKYLINKRPIWYAEEFAEDGFHVARNGYLVGASGFGVSVLSPWGELLLRIQTDFLVNNIQFASPSLDELWLFGEGKVSRVKWDLKGLRDGRS